MGASPNGRGPNDFNLNRLGGFVGRDSLLHLLCVDGDVPRLQLFRNLTCKLEVQEAVLELGTDYQDVVGELEAVLEGPAGNAAVQIAALLVLGLRDMATDLQHVILDRHFDIVVAKSGNGHGDTVSILVPCLDIVRRVR